ncbi:methyltransferase domain-containing protein [uncultured Roseivirga sp.]|uniref:class I SAM-dependent methyltransferase n=1 Tax=uncultured Roseivirga sp. TaxID=543088 RepID=UPI0030DC0709|tara:strand:- start:1792 stop:2322 length:531 start_codon:yes stop_codon:yes gene_type:complete
MTDKNKQVTKYRRFEQTLEFLKVSLPKGSKILDLGTPNDMSAYLTDYGYQVDNAYGVDFDLNPEIIAKEGYDAVTMFEVLEHLINPMGVLTRVKAPKLFASVPLSLWFAKAYRNKSDEWDQHFHEFEDWQFDWLVEKSGWKIVRTEKWTNPVKNIGFRAILRKFTPRYYIIEGRCI